jgi:sugar (pentulose or hexulose) kinase
MNGFTHWSYLRSYPSSALAGFLADADLLGMRVAIGLSEEGAWGAAGMIFWAFDPGPEPDTEDDVAVTPVWSFT